MYDFLKPIAEKHHNLTPQKLFQLGTKNCTVLRRIYNISSFVWFSWFLGISNSMEYEMQFICKILIKYADENLSVLYKSKYFKITFLWLSYKIIFYLFRI